MNVIARVGTFAAALAALGGGAAAIGAAVGPVDAVSPDRPSPHVAGSDHGDPVHGDPERGDPEPAGGGHADTPHADTEPAGLQVSQDGYAIRLDRVTHERSPRARLSFRIVGADGDAVTAFETRHGKQMHLILVRRDLDSFQHVHPVMRGDGTWTSEVDLSRPGSYRVFADFQPTDAERGLTLGHDLAVPGAYLPGDAPAPRGTDSVDGYEVRVAGRLVPGELSRLTVSVLRDGEPVTDLEPYLEAFGHLVALRSGDLAYLHVHPEDEAETTTPPRRGVSFLVEVPASGRYRLFFDFKHRGEVRTADFTVEAGSPSGSTRTPGSTHTH